MLPDRSEPEIRAGQDQPIEADSPAGSVESLPQTHVWTETNIRIPAGQGAVLDDEHAPAKMQTHYGCQRCDNSGLPDLSI